jgi:glycosyltransferase involved in cell wall biosynthesis
LKIPKLVKLIIQIPCFNEAESLPITFAELPASIAGIDIIETLVIDDGSTDGTQRVAEKLGVDHIIRLPKNLGLARAFSAGIDASLARGADIIVNTDADNQYHAGDIEKLVKPVLEGAAEMVVGARPISDIAHFSATKKLLQKFGSWVVRRVSGTDIPDAPSGFRALSRNAALNIRVFSEHTYTLETLIQAGRKGIPVTWVPVRVNKDLRPSRLVKNNMSYVLRSVIVIIRIFLLYQPLRFFLFLGAVPFSAGFLLGVRWMLNIFVFPEPGRTFLPSLILAAVLLLMGFQTWVLAFVADLMAANRSLLEENRVAQRRSELSGQDKPECALEENVESLSER